MGRFSPTVLPQATPGFAENLANALSMGVAAHEHFADKRQAREDRQRQMMDREDELVLHGIMPEGWTPPAETPSDQPATSGPAPTSSQRKSTVAPGFDGSLEGAMAAQPGGSEDQGQQVTEQAAPVAQSASGHPGGWDPRTRSFARVDPRLPEPITLPSGRVYDKGGQMQQAIAQRLMERQGELDLTRGERQQQVTERRTALQGLKGQPGYEKLTDALIEAGAQDPAVYNDLVKNEPKAWHPSSMAEALSLSNQEAEGRAASEARHRDPSIHAEQRSRAADDFAYRMVASAGGDIDQAFALGRASQAEASRLGVTRAHYGAALQKYRDRLTAKTKPAEDDDAFMAMVTGQQKDPTAMHSRNLPSSASSPAGTSSTPRTKAPPAPDSLLNQLDQEMNGDLEKIRSELKKRGYDPDA